MDYKMISELSLENGRFTIKVRIARIWESRNPRSDELLSLDVVVIDEKATAIEGTIKAKDACYFKPLLKEGDVYAISKFFVAPNKPKFRAVQHALILRFTRMTSFRKIGNITEIPTHVFSFVNFDELSDRIRDDVRDDVLLNDVIGHIISVGHLEEIYVTERLTKKKNLDIGDPSGNKMRITLWGKLAEDFPGDHILGQKNAVIIVLVGMTLRSYGGKPCLCSCSATKYYLDLAIPEVFELKHSLTDFSGATILSEREAMLSPDDEANDNKKSVFELQFLDTTEHQNTQFSCQATIKDIDESQGWWYRACPVCKLGVTVHEDKYWCGKCFSLQNSPLIWYKLHVTIEDESGCINFMMFGKTVEDIVGISAAALASIPQNKDRFILPPVLRELVGRIYIFRLSLRSRNVKKQSALKVMKILKEVNTNTLPPRDQLLAKSDASSSVAVIKEIKQEPVDDTSQHDATEIISVSDHQEESLKGKRKVAEDILEDENATKSGEKKVKK